MSRPKKIDKLELERYGVTIDIYLDKDTGTFMGTYNKDTRRNTQLAELRTALTKMVADQFSIEWHPFIKVTFPTLHYNTGSSFVGVNAERIHLGIKGEEVAYIDHFSFERRRDNGHTYVGERYWYWKGPFDPQATVTSDRGMAGEIHVTLPYSDELWERLGQIKAGITAIKTALTDLISGGPQHILTYGGVPALPSIREAP